jgi:hypothetical protein
VLISCQQSKTIETLISNQEIQFEWWVENQNLKYKVWAYAIHCWNEILEPSAELSQ